MCNLVSYQTNSELLALSFLDLRYMYSSMKNKKRIKAYQITKVVNKLMRLITFVFCFNNDS